MGFTPMLSPIAPHNLSYSGLVNKLPKHKVHFSDFSTQTTAEQITSPKKINNVLTVSTKVGSPNLISSPERRHSDLGNFNGLKTPGLFEVKNVNNKITDSIPDSAYNTLNTTIVSSRRSSSGSSKATTPTPGSPNNLFNLKNTVTPGDPNQYVKFGNENPFKASNQIYRTPGSGSVYQHPNKTPGSGSVYQPSSGGDDSPVTPKKKKKNNK
jgi:hypothetical protein